MTSSGCPRIQSFSVPSQKEHVLAWVDEMAKRERKSKSQVIIRCVEYYYRKKWPGNPQPPLLSSLKPQFVRDEALKEARLRQAVTFLRFNVRLSYRQIAMVVGRSQWFVRKHCKSMDPQIYPVNMNNRRISNKRHRSIFFKRNLGKYRSRFREWLAGKFKNVEEAFTF